MTATVFPSSVHPDEQEPGDHLARLLESFRRLTNGYHCAILSSVDPQNRPHARWMGALCFLSPDSILAITSPESRKIAQLRQNPHVQWVFHDTTLNEVLTVDAIASIIEDFALLKQLWNHFPDKSKAYFLQEDAHGPGFVILKTKIETVEWIAPRQHLSLRVPFASFAPFL